ncbi:MAG TPA: hypothetical protein VHM28_07550, partial [Anaerolineales bacterium]|nr:hypothetical protein [Anaerolineales bacterium]
MTREKLFSEKGIPLSFFLIAFLAYGLLIPWTGFYWDDWGFAWIAKFLGPADFISAFRGFRPFLGPIFYVTTSLIPPNPLLWQIFALIIRFAAALCAWFALDRVWPKYKRQTLIASFLFLVFPGYSQNWVALTHINQEWIPFIFYLLSFGYTASALRHPEKFRVNTILALLFLIMGVFPTEYFLTIEPLRFLFIWVIVSDEGQGWQGHFVQTIKHWRPYVLIWLTNVVWLAYYYKSGAYISYDVTTVHQTPSVGQTFFMFADALWKAGLYIWAQVLVLAGQSVTAPTSLLVFILILATFILLAFY